MGEGDKALNNTKSEDKDKNRLNEKPGGSNGNGNGHDAGTTKAGAPKETAGHDTSTPPPNRFLDDRAQTQDTDNQDIDNTDEEMMSLAVQQWDDMGLIHKGPYAGAWDDASVKDSWAAVKKSVADRKDPGAILEAARTYRAEVNSTVSNTLIEKGISPPDNELDMLKALMDIDRNLLGPELKQSYLADRTAGSGNITTQNQEIYAATVELALKAGKLMDPDFKFDDATMDALHKLAVKNLTPLRDNPKLADIWQLSPDQEKQLLDRLAAAEKALGIKAGQPMADTPAQPMARGLVRKQETLKDLSGRIDEIDRRVHSADPAERAAIFAILNDKNGVGKRVTVPPPGTIDETNFKTQRGDWTQKQWDQLVRWKNELAAQALPQPARPARPTQVLTNVARRPDGSVDIAATNDMAALKNDPDRQAVQLALHNLFGVYGNNLPVKGSTEYNALKTRANKSDDDLLQLANLYFDRRPQIRLPQGIAPAGGGAGGMPGQDVVGDVMTTVGNAATKVRDAVVGGQPATAGVPKPEMRQGAGPFDPTAQPKPAEAPQPAPVMRNAEPPRPASIPVPTDALTELRSKKFAEIQAMPAADRLHLLASFFKDKTFSATQTEPRFTDDSLTKEALLRDTINKGLAAGDPNIKTEADLKNLFGEYQKAVKELMQPGNIQKLSMAAIQDLPSYAINRGMKSLFKSMDVTKDWTDHKPKEREPVIKAWSKTPEEVATLYDLYKGTVNDVTNRINEVASTKADDIKKESAEERLYLLAPLFKDKVFSSSQPDLMASSDSTRDLFKRLGLDENDAKAKTEVQKLLVAYRDAANDMMKKGKIENLSIAAVQDLPNYAVVRGMRPFFKSMDITKNWDGSGGNRKADQQDAAIKAWGKSKTGEQVADLYKLYKDAVVVASSDKGKFDEVRNSTVDEIEKQSAEERLALLAPIFKDKTFSAKQDKPEFKDNTEDRDTLLVDINKGLPAGDARIKKADPDPTKGDLARLFKAYRDAANELTDQKTGAMKDLSLATIQNLPAHAVIIGMQKGFQSLDPTLELAEHARPKRLKVEQFWNGKTPEEIQDLYKLYQGTIQDYTMARVNKKFESIETFQALPYQTALISLRGDFHPDPLNLERGLDPSIYDQRLTLDKRWKELGEDKQTSLAASLSSTGTDTAKAKVLFETYLKAIAELEKDMYNQTLATIKMLPNASVINGLKPRFGAYKASSWSGLDAKIDQPVILNMFKGPDQLSRKDDQVAALYDEYKAAQWAQNGPAAWGDWALQGLGGGLQNTGNGLLYGGKLIWDNPKTSLGIAVGETILEYATRGHGAIGLPVRGAKWVLTGGPGRALATAGNIVATRYPDTRIGRAFAGLKIDAAEKDPTAALQKKVDNLKGWEERDKLRKVLKGETPEGQAYLVVEGFMRDTERYLQPNPDYYPDGFHNATNRPGTQARFDQYRNGLPTTPAATDILNEFSRQLGPKNDGTDDVTPNDTLQRFLENLNPTKAEAFLGKAKEATRNCLTVLREAEIDFNERVSQGAVGDFDLAKRCLVEAYAKKSKTQAGIGIVGFIDTPTTRATFERVLRGCTEGAFDRIDSPKKYFEFAADGLNRKAPPRTYIKRLFDLASKDVDAEQLFNGLYKDDPKSWEKMHKVLRRQFRQMVEKEIIPPAAVQAMAHKIDIFAPEPVANTASSSDSGAAAKPAPSARQLERESLGLVTVGHARDWCLYGKVKPDPTELKKAYERLAKRAAANGYMDSVGVPDPTTGEYPKSKSELNLWENLSKALARTEWVNEFSETLELRHAYNELVSEANGNLSSKTHTEMRDHFIGQLKEQAKAIVDKDTQMKRSREVIFRTLLENGMDRFLPTHIQAGWEPVESYVSQWEEAYKAGASDYEQDGFDKTVEDLAAGKASKQAPAKWLALELDKPGEERAKFLEGVFTGQITKGQPTGTPPIPKPALLMPTATLQGKSKLTYVAAAAHLETVVATYPTEVQASIRATIIEPLTKIGDALKTTQNASETVEQCMERLQRNTAWGTYEHQTNMTNLKQRSKELLSMSHVNELKQWAGADLFRSKEEKDMLYVRKEVNSRLEACYVRDKSTGQIKMVGGVPVIRKGFVMASQVLKDITASIDSTITHNNANKKNKPQLKTVEHAVNVHPIPSALQPRVSFHYSPEGRLEKREVAYAGTNVKGMYRTDMDTGKREYLPMKKVKEEIIKSRKDAKDSAAVRKQLANMNPDEMAKIWQGIIKGKSLDDIAGSGEPANRTSRLIVARQALTILLPFGVEGALYLKERFSVPQQEVEVQHGLNSGLEKVKKPD